MMKIAVAGATGRVGRPLVEVLAAGGDDVVAMSRSQGVDVATGAGLADALAGAACVIDVATGSSEDQAAATAFFTAAARNLQQAGARAGVGNRHGVDHRRRPVHNRLPGGEARARAGDAGRADPGAESCAPRSSTSSWGRSSIGAGAAT